MRRRFSAQLSDAEYAVYKAARALAQRNGWMSDAEGFKRRGIPEATKSCVRSARDRNREYLQAVSEYRALKAPKRKCA